VVQLLDGWLTCRSVAALGFVVGNGENCTTQASPDSWWVYYHVVLPSGGALLQCALGPVMPC
jgi:hypothetical protein